MLRSLTAGVTGLSAEQNALDVISNNITNINTVGFKAQRMTFQSLLEQTLASGSAPQGGVGGTNPMQVGDGVTTGGITTDESEGTLDYTGKATDMALSGDGYFVVSNGTKNLYTRDGSFDFDTQGNFIQPANGDKVLGWTAVNDALNAEGAPSPINIPRGMTLQPQPTTKITLQGNIQATADTINLAGVIQGSTTPGQPSPASPVTVECKILNSKNELVSGTISMTQEGSSQNWDVAFNPDAATVPLLNSPGPYSLGKLVFDNSGNVAQNTLVPLSLTYAATDGAITQNIPLDPSNLQIRTDVTSSQIGFNNVLPSDPSSASVSGAGLVYAGGYSMTAKFIDATGTDHTATIVFQRDLDAEQAGASTAQPVVWRALLTYNDPTIKDDTGTTGAGAGPIPIDMGTVSFDQTGALLNNSLNVASIKYLNGSASSNIQIDPGAAGDINGLTQFQSDSTALVSGRDGYPVGALTGMSVDPSGVVSGIFSNGETRKLAQVAVASFANPEGLLNDGSNLFEPGKNSGDALIGTAGTGGRATINSENLEQSNVDIAKQFADLIVAQQAFQADSKTITTSDQILQELMQLKQ